MKRWQSQYHPRLERHTPGLKKANSQFAKVFTSKGNLRTNKTRFGARVRAEIDVSPLLTIFGALDARENQA
jgi:hypothetical protein